MTRRFPPGARGLTAAGAAGLLAAGSLAVYGTGGTRYAWLHTLYIPILVAAWGFGVPGGIVAGVAAGLAVGPAMPLDVASATMQEPLNWLTRLGAFAGVGGVGGALFSSLRRRAAALATSERRFAALLSHAPDLIFVRADDGTIRYASPSAATVLGHQPERLVGRSLDEFVHLADRPALRAAVDAAGRASGKEVRFRHRDGSWRRLELQIRDLRADPAVAGVVLNGRDVTEWRAVEAELRHHARHDAVTGLLNRTGFRQLVGARLAEGRPVVLILFHLHQLRAILERHGHDESEQVLRAAARRLRELQEPEDLACRHGDAELALLRTDVAHHAAAVDLAERLRLAIAAPFTIGDEPIALPCSCGVAWSRPAEDLSADELLGNAHAALREARRRGGARTVRYGPELRDNGRMWLRTDAALRRALERSELRIHYQPVIDLSSGRLTGFEALLRWQHPAHGLIPPTEFVPIAERSGAIVPIGRWVLAEACAQLRRWQAEVPAADTLTMAVNVSPRQLEAADLADHVLEGLRAGGLDPHRLMLEVTETSVMPDPAESLRRLRQLHRVGVRLAIDDFGTGYASLEHLRTVPVDTLKIDQVFVRNLEALPGGDPIIGAVVGLARSMRLSTVAEGVERSDQANELRVLGCDRGQGYLFARPRPPEDLDIAAFTAKGHHLSTSG